MAIEMTVIPLPEAARRLRMDPDVLTCLVQNGELKVRAVRTPDGQIMLDEEDVERMAQAMTMRDKIWSKIKQFERETIGITKAESFGVSYPTLYRCIEIGWIRAVDQPSKGNHGKKRRLNKADVAYVSELAKRNGGSGQRLFTSYTVPPHAPN